MKDYYKILGVSPNASAVEIKRAFRELAFRYHPDRNPGNEAEAEARFKEINEAYAVLSDNVRRREYDAVRTSPGQGSFGYSPYDIFQGIFSNPAFFEEISRMFHQAGLRFDEELLNQVLFKSAPPRGSRIIYYEASAPKTSTSKPGWFKRGLSRLGQKAGIALLRLLGVKPEDNREKLDRYVNLKLSSSEAISGREYIVTYKSGGGERRLAVRVPPGVRSGTRIRLKGLGERQGNATGNLYIHITITDEVTHERRAAARASSHEYS